MFKLAGFPTVRFGGNTYINVPNLVVYRGTPLFRLRRLDDGMLGIDFEVHDANGRRIATFAKSVVVDGDATNYLIETGHAVYSVTERATGRVMARVQRRGVEGAELDVHVQLYLPNGFLLDAGPEQTNLGNTSLRSNLVMGAPVGIAIN